MKRILPPEPPTPRRKRSLSEEDRALWDSVARQIKPLRKKPRLTAIEPDAPDDVADAPSKPRKLRPVPVIKAPTPVPQPPSPPRLATLGRRERSQIARGRKEIDARIDLHGMTQARAHRALHDFLHRAHRDGLAVVLVITGKGKTTGPESERGILRRQVPMWLALPEFRSLVVGFDAAHIGHGGEGALYVRVRRAR